MSKHLVACVLCSCLCAPSARAQDERRSLSDAVLYGERATVERLIREGADVNAPDETGISAVNH